MDAVGNKGEDGWSGEDELMLKSNKLNQNKFLDSLIVSLQMLLNSK